MVQATHSDTTGKERGLPTATCTQQAVSINPRKENFKFQLNFIPLEIIKSIGGVRCPERGLGGGKARLRREKMGRKRSLEIWFHFFPILCNFETFQMGTT